MTDFLLRGSEHMGNLTPPNSKYKIPKMADTVSKRKRSQIMAAVPREENLVALVVKSFMFLAFRLAAGAFIFNNSRHARHQIDTGKARFCEGTPRHTWSRG
jgi:hypothetical protein